MISNLFCAFGKQEELQSRVKENIPKKWLQVRLCERVTFRCLKELDFCFDNQSAILFRSLWFHARKLDYWSSFLVMEVRRQDKGDIYPIRYLI